MQGSYTGRVQANGYGGYPVVAVDRLPNFVNRGWNHFSDDTYQQIAIPNMDLAENKDYYPRDNFRPHFWGWVYLENPQGERSAVYLELQNYNEATKCYDGEVYTVTG